MDYLAKAPRAALNGGISGTAIRDIRDIDANAARKPAAMETAIRELEGQHARLDSLVGELERRLSNVLLPAPPDAGQGEAHGDASPLAQKLFEETSTVRRLAERIDSIISRVDL